MDDKIIVYDESMMSDTDVDDDACLSSIEELLASPETLEKLTTIGKGTPSAYKSVTSVEEAKRLTDSILFCD